jgi:hypothetical protein
MKRSFVALFLAIAMIFAFAACSSFGVWSAKSEANIAKVETALQPLIAKGQLALTAIQADYPFWSAVAQGTLQAVGVKVTAAQMQAVLPYITAADTNLGVLGKAIAYNQNPTTAPPVSAADLQNAISATSAALPALAKQAMANPAVAVLYQAYIAGQTNLPPPTVAPASVPTS